MIATRTVPEPGLSATRPASGRPTDVLALATSTGPWSPAAQVGAALAARWGSLLTGCSIDPSLASLDGAQSEPSVIGLLLDTPAHEVETADAFRRFARQHGVPRAAWVTARSGLARTLRQLGAWHDLAVLERDMLEDDLLIGLLGEALLACRLPVLILPPKWHRTPTFPHVLVGWDGSLEASRAIHAALPFLCEAEKVILLDGGRRNASEQGAYAPPFEPFLFLARHQVEANLSCVELGPGEAGAGLLARCASTRADLLVMGAFGHAGLRERMLGGATRYVLRHAQVPVFLVH
jgi:nucleotide-binding universal stress UspA family protein